MCGIIGFITLETTRGQGDRRKFIDTAFIADTVRGDDGTGFFSVKHKMEEGEPADWLKCATDGYSFVQSKEYKEKLGISVDYSQYRAVIGHNRSATVGNIDVTNTHPFQEGPITLVHNGTLNSTYHMPASMQDLKKEGVEVDSHVICHNLATHDDPADVVKILDGAFALVWHDARNNSINVCRNDRRPLHMMFAKCEDTVLIASEGEMLYWLAKRNNFQQAPIVFSKPGELLTFLPGSLVPEVRSVPLYVPPIHSYGRSGGWHGQSYVEYNSATPTATAPWSRPTKIPEFMEDDLLELELDVETPIKFVPARIKKVEGQWSAVVSGTCYHPDGEGPLPGMLLGLSYAAVERAIDDNETWTVRAIGVRHLEDASPVLMIKLVDKKFKAEGNRILTPAEVNQKGRGVPRIGSRTPNDYVPGAHGEWIPVRDWLRNTADGCVQCGGELSAEDAEEIIWVDNQSRPLCPGCAIDNASVSMM